MRKNKFWLVIILLFLVSLACQTSPVISQWSDFLPSKPPVLLGTIKTIQPGAGKATNEVLTDTPSSDIALTEVVDPTATSDRSQPNSADLRSVSDILVGLYEAVSPGVVSIQAYNSQGGSLGSGFVYDKEGHIITNLHVVQDATDIEVDFPSGIKVRAEVVGTDADSDLAVIKVIVSPDDLFPLVLGDSDQVKVGQSVVAIGNPFGLTGTMTLGIISAKGRTLESLHVSESGGVYSAGDLIQTDASINPGNSGGPLINLDGEVVGLNRAIRTTSTNSTGEPVNSGIGFAISVNTLKRVIPVLIKDKKYDYPYLGMSAREDLSLLEMEALGITHSTGAYVVLVTTGGPSDLAGLRGGTATTEAEQLLPPGGDLIIAVDDRPVKVFGDLLSYLMLNKSPGDKIILTVLRDKKEMKISITLGKRP